MFFTLLLLVKYAQKKMVKHMLSSHFV
uniref:Uncharacterized protein n=1 Tax=Arundo donax TaxID=35708 RepID=A0A0A8XZV4_ARUDO